MGHKPAKKGIKLERCLTNSDCVVYLMGMNSSGQSKARGSRHLLLSSPFESGLGYLPRKTVWNGTWMSVWHGMYVSPTVIPSAGVRRWTPDGTAGWRRRDSWMMASSKSSSARESSLWLESASSCRWSSSVSFLSRERWKNRWVMVAEVVSLTELACMG